MGDERARTGDRVAHDRAAGREVAEVLAALQRGALPADVVGSAPLRVRRVAAVLARWQEASGSLTRGADGATL